MRKNGSASSVLTGVIALFCIIGTSWFLFVNPGRLREILFPTPPCSKPIAYSIGSIDPRFGLATSTILENLTEVNALWSNAVNKPLFRYDPKGSLKINFIYDDRQSATDKLKELGYHISKDTSTYESLKSKVDLMKIKVASKKTSLDSQTAAFNAKSDAYSAEVDQWNAKGGATPEVVARLNALKSTLTTERDQLARMIQEYNQQTVELNALVTTLNGIAKEVNGKVDTANNVTGNGEEFEEGEYVVDKTGKEINIYEFDTEKRLIRVLAHEFGHALGLDHVDDTEAIMYYLNQDKSGALSDADILQLTALCKGKR